MKKISLDEYWKIVKELPSYVGETQSGRVNSIGIIEGYTFYSCPRCRGTMYDVTAHVEDNERQQVRRCKNCGQDYHTGLVHI